MKYQQPIGHPSPASQSLKQFSYDLTMVVQRLSVQTACIMDQQRYCLPTLSRQINTYFLTNSFIANNFCLQFVFLDIGQTRMLHVILEMIVI